MRLVFLYGPPAVGKLTVGSELAALTGFKLIHNHLTVNPLLAVFPRESAPYRVLLREIRRRIYEEAARAGIDLIATWAHPRGEDDAAREYAHAVESNGGRFLPVQLVCDRDLLLGRVGDASRRAMHKLADPVRAAELLDERYEVGPLPFGDSLVVDTGGLRPEEAAARIADHYRLPRSASS
jgi:hypothetical protein